MFIAYLQTIRYTCKHYSGNRGQKMSPQERRLAEIYSYYVIERYENDLTEDFHEWIATSMYGNELTLICDALLDQAMQDIKPASLKEVEFYEAEYLEHRFDEDTE